MKIRAGIAGSAGYTGGELIRLLLRHPGAEIAFAQSSSNAGKALHSVHGDLLGETDLSFSEGISHDIDVLFLCMGHGDSKKFLAENSIPDSVRIIDLSQDFRIKGGHHFIYGLPELNRDDLLTARRDGSNIANPGCFATCIQLALLPLAKAGLLSGDVHTTAITGSTGAGRSPGASSHFSWRSGNMQVYKAFTHQHLGEIGQSLSQLSGNSPRINFIPYRGNFTRGIIASSYTRFEGSIEEAQSLYRAYYAGHPFVFVADENPDLKQVVNTNKCILYLEQHEDRLLIISMIDNLLKGASGQAVQNMNLVFGLDEQAGLLLKASAF